MKRVFIFKFYIFVLCLPGSILSMDECASRIAKIMMMADGVSSQDADKTIKFSQECLEKSCNIAAASFEQFVQVLNFSVVSIGENERARRRKYEKAKISEDPYRLRVPEVLFTNTKEIVNTSMILVKAMNKERRASLGKKVGATKKVLPKIIKGLDSVLEDVMLGEFLSTHEKSLLYSYYGRICHLNNFFRKVEKKFVDLSDQL